MKRVSTLALLLSAACARPGLPSFPLGLYGIEKPADVVVARSAGFDAFQSYAENPGTLEALAQAARREGMAMLVSPVELISSSVATRAWPIAAWYLQDEPDVNGVSPAQLDAWEKRVRAWSPGRPTTFVVGLGTAAASYQSTGDALMVDWYPIPHLPLASVGEQVLGVVAVAGARPVWAVLQAMDWRDYPQRDPKKPRIGRFPEYSELRFMSYDAVLAGARGLWYFTLRQPSGRSLADRPGEWRVVAGVAREMRAMIPIFARGKMIPLPFDERMTGARARSWRYRGRDYVVLINRHDNKDDFIPREILGGSWRPLFETRRDPRELLRRIGDDFYLRRRSVLVLESRPRFFSR